MNDEDLKSIVQYSMQHLKKNKKDKIIVLDLGNDSKLFVSRTVLDYALARKRIKPYNDKVDFIQDMINVYYVAQA